MVNQVPAYLQTRQSKTVTERAATGLGASMPPHISIQGNSFTLIDAAGNEQNEGGQIDVCIADISDVVCKRYYGDKAWTPDSNDPPLCFSANGVSPSRDASSPQNAICATCRHNERGSAISKISGASIKACRDEKWLALILPKYPTMLFQMVLTPGSFKNWKEFTAPFEKHQVEISDYITRMSFEPKVNGVLKFNSGIGENNIAVYIDETTFKAREGALTGKLTDLLVGRTDVPIQGQLTAPQQQAPAQIEQPVQPAANPAFGAPAAEQPTTRRRRNTAQEAPAQIQQGQPLVAPFAQPQPTQPNGGAPFGMAAGATPDAGLQATLDGLFGKK